MPIVAEPGAAICPGQPCRLELLIHPSEMISHLSIERVESGVAVCSLKDATHFALDLWVETLESGIESDVFN